MANTWNIYFYSHECQLGDYVYSDGSFSDILRKDLTVIGICFYIDANDKTRRLCVAPKSLPGYAWGLQSVTNVVLSDNPSYDAYSVNGLKSYMSPSAFALTEESYKDNTITGDGAGFKVFGTSNGLSEIGWCKLTEKVGDYNAGEEVPFGLINTLYIILHRNKILYDSGVNLPVPKKSENKSEYANLLEMMNDVVANNGGNSNYKEFYFPPASLCHSYEPVLNEGEFLSPKFAAGRWWLPSIGELGRIAWYYSKGYSNDEVEEAIFAKPNQAGVFTAIAENTSYHSSNQANSKQYSFFSRNASLSYSNKLNQNYFVPITMF